MTDPVTDPHICDYCASATPGTFNSAMCRCNRPPVTQEAVERLTRPIIGMENRTPLEVFDIMCDRIIAALTKSPPPKRRVVECGNRQGQYRVTFDFDGAVHQVDVAVTGGINKWHWRRIYPTSRNNGRLSLGQQATVDCAVRAALAMSAKDNGQ